MTGRCHTLELFTRTLFDCWAEHTLQSVRWARAKTATQERWLEYAGQAKTKAEASQLSPAARERLPNPPDMDEVAALELSSLVDGARSRATTRAGVRRARKTSGREIYVFWVPAVRHARATVQAWISEWFPEQLQTARDTVVYPQLYLPHPAADRPLSLDEAPY